MAWEIEVLLLGGGILAGWLMGVLVGSPTLERRRWKTIWEIERWLKDLQDFIDATNRDVQALQERIGLTAEETER